LNNATSTETADPKGGNKSATQISGAETPTADAIGGDSIVSNVDLVESQVGGTDQINEIFQQLIGLLTKIHEQFGSTNSSNQNDGGRGYNLIGAGVPQNFSDAAASVDQSEIDAEMNGLKSILGSDNQ